jgi:hypothetical protein
MVGRALFEDDDETPAPRWLLPLAVFGSWLVAVAILYWQTRNVDFTLPMQNYDSATHNEMVRGMMNRGTISPFGYQESIDLYGRYYPLGFTSLAYIFVTLFGVGIPTGISLAWGVGAAILWPLGCAYFVRAILPHRIMPTVLAPVIAMCFAQYPLGILHFGTLYPYGLASSLLPWLIGATVLIARGLSPADLSQPGLPTEEGEDSDGPERVATPAKNKLTWREFPWRPTVVMLVSAALILYTQPRVGLVYLLIAVPYLALWWYRRFWCVGHVRLVMKAWLPASLLLVAGAALGYAYVAFGDKLFDTSLWKLTPAVMSWPHASGTYLTGSSYVDASSQTITVGWGLFVLSVSALVAVAMMCPDQRWLLAGWLLVGVVFCCAAAGESIVLRIISLPWYRQELRVYASYPLVMVPIICVGWDAIGVWLAGRLARVGSELVVAVACILAAVAGLFSPGLNSTADAIVLASSQPGGLLDEAKTQFYDECLPVVGSDRVAADPWSGAMFAFSAHDINIYFNTFGPVGEHIQVISTIRYGDLTKLRNYGVSWVMDLGPIWSDFDEAHGLYTVFHDAESFAVLEPILSVWDPYLEYNLTLYRIPPQ